MVTPSRPRPTPERQGRDARRPTSCSATTSTSIERDADRGRRGAVVTAWTVVFAALVDRRARASSPASRSQKRNAARAAAASRVSPRRPTQRRQRRRRRACGQRSTGRPERPRGRRAGAAPASHGTTGQIKLVDGSNIYITTSDGSTVKVHHDVDVEGDEDRLPAPSSDLEGGRHDRGARRRPEADGTIAAEHQPSRRAPLTVVERDLSGYGARTPA